MSFELKLEKNQAFNLDLSKDPTLENIRIEMRWNSNPSLDLDLFVFGLDNDQHIPSPEAVVFHRNKVIPGVELLKDVRASGSDDVESMVINTSKLELPYYDLFIFLAVEDVRKNLHLGQLTSGSVVVINDDTDEVIQEYRLANLVAGVTAMHLARIGKAGESWEFAPVGDHYNIDANNVIAQYNS